MKPRVIAHMMSSIDGKSLPKDWDIDYADDFYNTTAAKFKADAWVCGRVTMQELCDSDDYPQGLSGGNEPREDYIAKRGMSQYALSIDPKGLVPWKSDMVLESHVVEVLTEQVTDDYLAHLRKIGASFIFCGKTELDLEVVLQKASEYFQIKTLIVEGGPHVSGSFVNAGLVDEISVVVMPLIDAREPVPSSFEVPTPNWNGFAHFELTSVEKAEHQAVWLHYAKKS